MVLGAEGGGMTVDEVMPDPDGGVLLLPTRCYVDAEHRRPRKHDVLLLPDWSVDTGHDLEAERVAVALGGYLSCIALVDHVIPAARTYLQRQLRLEVPDVRHGATGAWSVRSPVRDCCGKGMRFWSAQTAAAHVRSAKHIASEFGAPRAEVASVVAFGQALLTVRDQTLPVRPPEDGRTLVGSCVDRMQDVVELWEAGLGPDAIRRMHEDASVGRPLGTSFYLGVLSNHPDLRWVHDTAARVPERYLHPWLAWSETPLDRRLPQRRGDWLDLGISQRDIAILADTAYTPADVQVLARSLRTSSTRAGATLASWVAAGCASAVEDIIRVHSLAGGVASAPSRSSVDRLAKILKPLNVRGRREDLAFALRICGTVPSAAAVVAAVGSLDLNQIATRLLGNEDERTREPSSRPRTFCA